MRDCRNRIIELGDWIKAWPLNPVLNRVPEGQPVIGRVCFLVKGTPLQTRVGSGLMSWLGYGPMPDVPVGPQVKKANQAMHAVYVDAFNAMDAEIVLKWDGELPLEGARIQGG